MCSTQCGQLVLVPVRFLQRGREGRLYRGIIHTYDSINVVVHICTCTCTFVLSYTCHNIRGVLYAIYMHVIYIYVHGCVLVNRSIGCALDIHTCNLSKSRCSPLSLTSLRLHSRCSRLCSVSNRVNLICNTI